MKVLIMRIDLRASWVNSLKEKRMVVKSILKKLQNTFNISTAEIDNQDIHKSISIGVSKVATDSKICDATIEKIIQFIEEATEAEITNIEQEVISY